ncbi:MAG: hypothetical protein WC277_06695 [Bacilli bacterium]
MSATAAFATLKDAPHAQWVADVLKADIKLAADVKTYGVKPEAILTPAMQKQLGFLQYSTAITKGVADIKRVVYEMKQKESATEISGILAGMRDVYGTGQPVRLAILKKDGRHIEISTFDPQLPMEGKKVSVNVPSQVTIAADYDEEYNSYNAVSLVSHSQIDRDTFMNALFAVAKSPKEIYVEDKGSVAVIRGRIQYVNPSPRWKNKAVDGEEAVWQSNQRRNPQGHPVARFKLYEEEMQAGGLRIPVSVSATIAHMKNVAPIVEITDLEGMCQYAVTTEEDPKAQARLVQDIVKDREVLIVGRVSGYEPKPDKTYVNLDVHSIYQIGDAQAPIASGGGEPEPVEEPMAAPEPVPEPAPAPTPAPEPEPAQDSIPATSPAAQVIAYLDAVVMISGVKPADLDGKQIWEEKFQEKMSFEVFDVILTQYKVSKK